MTPLIPGHKSMAIRRMNAKRFAHLVQLLLDDIECYTIPTLAEMTGLARPVVWEYVTELRAVRPRILRVGDWHNCRSDDRPLWVAAFTFGSGPDAKRPGKKNGAERCREYRQRKRQREIDAVVLGTAR